MKGSKLKVAVLGLCASTLLSAVPASAQLGATSYAGTSEASAVSAAAGVSAFYNTWQTQPIWFRGGVPSPAVAQLVSILQRAPFDGFAENGRRYGPFDVALIKIGAYGDTWPDIHLTPEQAVHASTLVQGRLLFPIHWGTFNLAFHDWSEPAERVVAAASAAGIPLVVPKPGEWIEPSAPPPVDPWWRAVTQR